MKQERVERVNSLTTGQASKRARYDFVGVISDIRGIKQGDWEVTKSMMDKTAIIPTSYMEHDPVMVLDVTDTLENQEEEERNLREEVGELISEDNSIALKLVQAEIMWSRAVQFAWMEDPGIEEIPANETNTSYAAAVSTEKPIIEEAETDEECEEMEMEKPDGQFINHSGRAEKEVELAKKARE